MSILDALKKLVVKRGGTPKGSNIAEVIDDLAETDSSGGGDVVVLDLNKIPFEQAVDFIVSNGDETFAATVEKMFLYDIDYKKFYVFRTETTDDYDGVFTAAYYITGGVESVAANPCEDTSEEQYVEAKTVSVPTAVYLFSGVGGTGDIWFAPTSTEFKTYKKVESSPDDAIDA